MNLRVFLFSIFFFGMTVSTYAADIEAGKKVYDQVCGYCHLTTYDDKFGPGLAGISERRDEKWLNAFLLDPQEMIKTDEYAQSLKENNSYNLTMPKLRDMQDEQKRADVIAYMETLE